MNVSGLFKPGAAPPTAFYFSVKFMGMDDIDSGFQEVSGLKSTFGLEERKEGGENSFVHQFPTTPKFENLVLKRCLIPNSKLDKWCTDAFSKFRFDPRDIQIALLGVPDGGVTASLNAINPLGTQRSKILASWNVVHAFPLSWELTGLNSTSNKLAIETLTLKYRYFKRET